MTALGASRSHAQQLPATSEETRKVDTLVARFSQPDSPGCAIGIWQGGKTLYARGYGLANVEEGIASSPRTVFHAASVSKQFTAFALALLIEDGKVDPRDDVRQYLRYVPDLGAVVRVEHLIHQTSGLRDHGPYWMLAGRDFRDLTRQQPLLNLIARQTALNFLPGAEFQYTNTNYTLIAEIVKTAAGKSFRDFCAQRIFKPLGMHSTFFCDDITETVKSRAQSYRPRGNGWGRAILSFEYVGGTGLHTTIEDLMRWCGNVLSEPRVGDRALMRKIMAPAALNDGTPVPYGYGLNSAVHNGRPYVLHTGGDAGFNTVTAYFPRDAFGVVILQNVPGEVATLARSIADIYLDGGVRKGEEEASVDPAILAGAPGHYLGRFSRLARIEARDGALFLQWSDDAPLRLRSLGGGMFDEGESLYGTYRFERDRAGRFTGMTQRTIVYGGVTEAFRRIDPVDPQSLQLEALTGDYRNAEVEITYRFEIVNGKLTARSMWSAAPIVFTPAAKDRFDSPDRAMAVIEFKRDGQGVPTGFVTHSQRTRNIWFERVSAQARPFGPIFAS